MLVEKALSTNDKKITNREFDEMASPMELDLVAIFNTWMDESVKLLGKAERDHWTEDRFVKEIKKLKE